MVGADDLTEHGDADSLEVVIYGAADAQRRRDAGFSYTVRIADLAQDGRGGNRAASTTTPWRRRATRRCTP